MNIYDMAREAGVSIATISRVVNGKSVVNAKTREKVEAVLKKNNYTPDPTARSLVVKSTKSVAILAEDVRDSYCGGICHAIERELCRIGYTTMLCNTGGTVQGISSSLKSALAHRTDGIIIAGMTHSADDDAKNAARSVPVVVINNFIDAPGVYSVICDEIYGMMLAVSHLAEKNKRDIIFVQDVNDDSYSAKKLMEGFDAGMAMNDLSSDGQIVMTEKGFDGGFACAEEMFRDRRQFNAAVCGDDTTAAGLIKSLRQNYLDIPEDVSVVGFHNTLVAQCSTPALTSVDCRSDNAGVSAVKLLSDLFENGHTQRKAVVLPRLILREST